MRVISGIARGTSLFPPHGEKTRPTSDFVKENLFNIIMDDVRGTNFLDLFAGSGAIGIEALSRGAIHATFVDISQKCVDLTKRNLEKTRLKEKATVMKGDAASTIKKLAGQKFDIIFLDPPYDESLANKTLQKIYNGDIMEEEGYIILEMDRSVDTPKIDGLITFKEREYSSTKLVFLEKAQGEII
ncbi:MAG: 16S rRNA (guanine(966)-N(2))-methyltransferase RsmD [Defluviitaleaceae bacterium]|nr:16S rRNA (guanine(966)-N(2))-methyltransferase RsmD [Defluviitaleaceae bacterium]